MIDRIEKPLKILGIVVAICVAVLGLYEYMEDLRQAKINRSYEYSHRYHSGEILNIRLQLRTNFDVINASSLRGDISEDELQNEMIKMLASVQNRPQYEILVEFLDDVYACAKLGLCDKETTYDLFAKKTLDLLRFTWPFITHIRELSGHSTFALALECITERGEGEKCKK